jgi:HD superfamily phosphohydrolase YqeK
MEKGTPLQKLLHTFAALADLGQEIADTRDFDEKMRTALYLVQGSLGIMRCALALFESDKQTLRFIAARGMGQTLPEDLALNPQDVSELRTLSICALTKPDEVMDGLDFLKRNHGLFDSLRADLIVPLVVREKLLGMIVLGGKATGEPFTTEETDLICAMARHIGVGIHEHRLFEELARRAEENRHLYDGMRVIYRDTVRAFAAAIDFKDKYTEGHSQRVGKFSEIIAREMGWNEEEVEGIAVAGYLHDIGKLVVEKEIINAPYKIDAKQSNELNRHPAIGYEILSPINHPYADIPLAARYHHERVDGRGYPDGLTGDQIPLVAKIVCLADSFDAMTTDRPYRKRRQLEEVMEDFRKNSGKQFAPEVVISFCRAMLREVKGEAKNRIFIKMLGKDYIEHERITPLLEELIEDLESGALSATVGNA